MNVMRSNATKNIKIMGMALLEISTIGTFVKLLATKRLMPISIDFAEEALLLDTTTFDQRFYVIDRGTMINILTHTDAFSIGTGILSDGFAGPELTSRPIRGRHQDIRLGWIQPANTTISDEASAFIQEVKQVLNV